jgi:hypothetical protein
VPTQWHLFIPFEAWSSHDGETSVNITDFKKVKLFCLIYANDSEDPVASTFRTELDGNRFLRNYDIYKRTRRHVPEQRRLTM